MASDHSGAAPNGAPLLARLGLIAGVLACAVVAYVTVIEPWHRNGGASAVEVHATWPGDEQSPGARYVTTRAVAIDAPPEAVWPWIVQMGQGRAGLYSYEGLENLAGCDVHNADRIHRQWQDVRVGDAILPVPRGWMGLADAPKWTVTAIEPGHFLVLSGFAAFVLRPAGASATRLVVRGRAASALAALEPFSFVMIRRMMLGIKERAEGTRPPAVLDGMETVLWLATFACAVAGAVWTLRRQGWRAAFALFLESTAVFLLLLFARPPLGIAVLLAVITVVGFQLLRGSQRDDEADGLTTSPPSARVRVAAGAGALACIVIALLALGWRSWQFWVFLVGADLGVLLGLGRGLEPGQLHPRGVPLYNALHRFEGPAILAVLSLWFGPACLGAASAWTAHLLFDRSVGLGPRNRDGFITRRTFEAENPAGR